MATTVWQIQRWTGPPIDSPDHDDENGWLDVGGSFGQERDAKETLHRKLRKEHDEQSPEERAELEKRDLDVGDWYRIRRKVIG